MSSANYRIPSPTVLVTGGNAYIAQFLIDRLLTDPSNPTIHTTARNGAATENIRKYFAEALSSGRLKIFEGPDLHKPGSFKEALEGCTSVFYTLCSMSPLNDFDGPEKSKESIKTHIDSTMDFMRSCAAAKVKTVVWTLSFSVTGPAPREDGRAATEEDENKESTEIYFPYFYGKALAETEAIRYIDSLPEYDKFRLVTINPFAVIGPLYKGSLLPSNNNAFMVQFNVTSSFMFDVSYGFTDIRDLVDAHIQAWKVESAKGRYLCVGSVRRPLFIRALAKKEFPEYFAHLGSFVLPRWLVSWILPFVKQLDVKSHFMHYSVSDYKFDCSKAERELGVKFRPVEETMKDSIADLIQCGYVSKPKKSSWWWFW
ncbi:hypothetical protein BJ742DRAFT_843842 [Cladochytrium replicatum]|nr:hypothetical protein BJ742DRAFT_843842 [Cladochytrium replicatum]